MHGPSKPYDWVTLPEEFVCPCGKTIPEETTHVVAARLTGRTAYLSGLHYCDPSCFSTHVEEQIRGGRNGLTALELRDLARWI